MTLPLYQPPFFDSIFDGPETTLRYCHLTFFKHFLGETMPLPLLYPPLLYPPLPCCYTVHTLIRNTSGTWRSL
jgi:hypothetical protein